MKPDVEGRYANYLQVGHNALEFVLDFGQLFKEDSALIHSRVITHPHYAKIFLNLLADSVAEYEGEFGQIPADVELEQGNG